MEAQSDNSEEENGFLFSQNPIAQSPQTQSPSDQVESIHNYKGRKPLIGECIHIVCDLSTPQLKLRVN